MLTSLKQKNPDALYLVTVFADVALAMKQAKDLGLKLDVLGPDGLYSDDLIKLGGPAVEGVCATALGADVNKLPTASKFVEGFKKKYNESPQQYSVFAYEAMHILGPPRRSARRTGLRSSRPSARSRPMRARWARRSSTTGATPSTRSSASSA